MPGFNDGLLDRAPAARASPRERGLTHVMDKGLNIRDIEGMFDTGGRVRRHRQARLGHELRHEQPREEDRALPLVRDAGRLRRHAVRGGLRARASWTSSRRGSTEHRFSHVEISDGTLDIPRDEKLELIADFARDFTVLSEVGSKDSDVVYAPYQWVEWIKEELEAGAWKVITEAREGGTAGIFRKDGDMRTGLIDEIAHEVSIDDLIFEAPTKASQAWFVKHFGPNVNLGNIPPDEVIPLETLRLGLRGDTAEGDPAGAGAARSDRHVDWKLSLAGLPDRPARRA